MIWLLVRIYIEYQLRIHHNRGIGVGAVEEVLTQELPLPTGFNLWQGQRIFPTYLSSAASSSTRFPPPPAQATPFYT